MKASDLEMDWIAFTSLYLHLKARNSNIKMTSWNMVNCLVGYSGKVSHFLQLMLLLSMVWSFIHHLFQLRNFREMKIERDFCWPFDAFIVFHVAKCQMILPNQLREMDQLAKKINFINLDIWYLILQLDLIHKRILLTCRNLEFETKKSYASTVSRVLHLKILKTK